ncbi:hypothetical protein C4J81_14885 [Deltaproteobacteria bacterium Smac51]|nr:hypothetical protein C4J81_14885 [Deltaproteobacteria bacterium Smac51]
MFNAFALASAINHNPDSRFWAMLDSDDPDMAYIFCKDGGDYNHLRACEDAARHDYSQRTLEAISFYHPESDKTYNSGVTFSLGGEDWGTMKAIGTKFNKGSELWNVTLSGRDVGNDRDLWIAAAGELDTPGLEDGLIDSLDRHSFIETQNAADAPWRGAEVRTQSSAQEALDAIGEAIARKDKIRAQLGAYQNRLENTITNMEIQAENLETSESRISDVDMATEMTEFVRNQVITQAAVSMLSQANSLPQMALSLLNG